MVVNISGRGDKDVEVAADALGIGSEEAEVVSGDESSNPVGYGRSSLLNDARVRDAFREGRTALVPYLTGGYPSLEGAREVGEAYLGAGADVLEIGVPFSDPLADGPTIQDTTTRALEMGPTWTTAWSSPRGFRRGCPSSSCSTTT